MVGVHQSLVVVLLDGVDCGFEVDVDAEVACQLDELGYEIGVEALERTLAAV